MTIVCGTDFSDHASEAVRIAAAFAARMSDTVELVHAVEGSASAYGGLDVLEPKIRERLTQEAETIRGRGVGVMEIVQPGSPDDVLVEVAQKTDARLIVMASLGRRAAGRWTLGSIADRTVQASPAPVLVARDPAPFEAWANGERPLRVMLGTDLSPASSGALAWVGELRRAGPCDVTVAHVAWPAGEHARLAVSRPIPLDRFDPEVESILLRDLRAWTGELPGSGAVELLVRPGLGRADHHLTTLAREAGVDLLVVGLHQRSMIERLWHGSVSRGVLQWASMSVVCVPATARVTEVAVPKLQRVLVTTDLSPLGNRAIPFAYALAGEGGEVHLLYVQEDAEEVDPTERLRALVPPSAPRGVTTQIQVVRGSDPAASIYHAAERLCADTVCMSSHGRGGVAGIIAGSVAKEVLARSRRPVFLVPPPREA